MEAHALSVGIRREEDRLDVLVVARRWRFPSFMVDALCLS
jgi:hypothetical protein